MELRPRVRDLRPKLRVLVVRMHAELVLADTAELRAAIASVLAGYRHVSPGVPRHTHRAALDAVHAGLANVTPRQQEILMLIAEGLHSAEIAERLGVTPAAIAFHRKALRKALGLDTEWALNRFAILIHLAREDARAEGNGTLQAPAPPPPAPSAPAPRSGTVRTPSAASPGSRGHPRAR